MGYLHWGSLVVKLTAFREYVVYNSQHNQSPGQQSFVLLLLCASQLPGWGPPEDWQEQEERQPTAAFSNRKGATGVSWNGTGSSIGLQSAEAPSSSNTWHTAGYFMLCCHCRLLAIEMFECGWKNKRFFHCFGLLVSTNFNSAATTRLHTVALELVFHAFMWKLWHARS